MQFQVPQFIETEDKIIGPFSIKQFIYVGAAIGISFMLYFTVQAWLWIALSLIVVGLALALNTVLAVALGGAIPLVLKRLNIDPAVAAAPMLTTVVDMCGFFLILSFAAAVLA